MVVNQDVELGLDQGVDQIIHLARITLDLDLELELEADLDPAVKSKP